MCSTIIYKLLAFTFAMITFPIGSYFLSVNIIFGGLSCPYTHATRQTYHKPTNKHHPPPPSTHQTISQTISQHKHNISLTSPQPRQLNLRRRHRRHRRQHRPALLRRRRLQRRQIRARSRPRLGCHPAQRRPQGQVVATAVAANSVSIKKKKEASKAILYPKGIAIYLL